MCVINENKVTILFTCAELTLVVEQGVVLLLNKAVDMSLHLVRPLCLINLMNDFNSYWPWHYLGHVHHIWTALISLEQNKSTHFHWYFAYVLSLCCLGEFHERLQFCVGSVAILICWWTQESTTSNIACHITVCPSLCESVSDGLCDRVSAMIRVFPRTCSNTGLNPRGLMRRCWYHSGTLSKLYLLTRGTSNSLSVTHFKLSRATKLSDCCIPTHPPNWTYWT